MNFQQTKFLNGDLTSSSYCLNEGGWAEGLKKKITVGVSFLKEKDVNPSLISGKPLNL